MENFQGSTASVDIDLWTIDLRTIDLTAARPEILSAEEAYARRVSVSEADRNRWVRSHSALRVILGGYAQQPPASLEFECGEHGKPALRDFPRIDFNLSHAGDYAMVAVSHAGPVGVDIERIRTGLDIAALLRRLGEDDLPTDEFALYQGWTHREAIAKAAGNPLFEKPGQDVRAVAVSAPAGLRGLSGDYRNGRYHCQITRFLYDSPPAASGNAGRVL